MTPPEHLPSVEIVVDGRADESIWASVPPVAGFVTTAPSPGLAPTGDTELRWIFDDRRLMVLFVAHDPEPDRIRAGLGRRDSRITDDGVALYVDPRGLGQRAYVFGCNALGVPFDGVRTALEEEDDLSWDARWDCAATRTEDGYAVEMAIPWRAIRHPPYVEQVGFLATRTIGRNAERSAWPEVDPQAPSLIAQQALGSGPGRLPVSRGLDLVPELTFGVDEEGVADDRLSWSGFGPGLTARYAPSPALQLLGTVNPDFSQVETDAARVTVNRRYAIDYDEKRPFFLEGQEWFGGAWERAAATRSIVAPVYGARGTVEAGGFTVALLHALDGHPAPSVSEGGGFTAAEIGDAPAFDTLARARWSSDHGASFGLLASDKELPEAGLGSRMGGVDATLQLGERWAWTGAIAASSTTDVADGQLAPAAQTSLTYGTERVQSFTELSVLSPGFRVENGFEVYADRADAAGGLFLRAFPPSGVVRQWLFIPVQGDIAFTMDGTPRSYEIEPETKVKFDHGWRAQASVFVEGEAFEGAWLPYQQPNVGVGGPVGRWLDVVARVYAGTGPYYDEAAPRVGHIETAELDASVQVGPRVSLAVAGEAERMLDAPSIVPLDAPTLYAGFAGRAQLLVFATPRLWGRLLLDRSSFDGLTTADALAAFEKGPGTAVYAGGSVGFVDGSPEPVSWAAVAKLSLAIGI